jgi:hypothetical protein
MQFLQTYRHYAALFILGLFSFVLATQAVHSFVHHHDEVAQLCNDTCDDSKTHFHATEKEIKHCTLCEFCFSPVEIPTLYHFELNCPKIQFNYSFSYEKIFQSTTKVHTALRGPPNTL